MWLSGLDVVVIDWHFYLCLLEALEHSQYWVVCLYFHCVTALLPADTGCDQPPSEFAANDGHNAAHESDEIRASPLKPDLIYLNIPFS